MTTRPRSPWTTLGVLAVAQFMVVLDVTIVNVALPDIQQDLGFSASSLQWVVGAYTLVFGGFLLIGGRTGDLVGRRRVFACGLALFAFASLAAGLAPSEGWLVALRALQGLGGALLSPAAFSILTVTFAHGRERNLAMGIWGGLAGLGGTLGTVIGGLLVDSVGWRWIFLVNVPIALTVLVFVPVVLEESRAEQTGVRRTYDLAGTVTSTVGLLALMFAVIRAERLGWGSGEVIGLLALAVVLAISFVAIEKSSVNPLVPLSLFSSRGLTTATLALALNGAAFLAMFFLTAVYLQQAKGLSALETGVQMLPMGIGAIVSAAISSQLVTRLGTRPVQLAGTALSAGGLLLLTRVNPTGNYVTDLLPGLVLFGLGIIAISVPAQIAAVAEVRNQDAGAASGVVNAGFQVGGALGLAIISSLSAAHVADSLATGASPTAALTDSFHFSLVATALFALANLAVTLVSPAVHPTAQQVSEAAGA